MSDVAGQQLFSFRFDTRFMSDHAGSIIEDPRVALVEIVANSYDAGARRVDVLWPEDASVGFSVEDDGTGMTDQEFIMRWSTWNFNRLTDPSLGAEVRFPPGVSARNRTAFGRNGKGRHAPFCFANHYSVQSWRGNAEFRAQVRLADQGLPIAIDVVSRGQRQGHGTKVASPIARNHMAIAEVVDLLAAKFMVDPDFAIFVNGRRLELADIRSIETSTVDVGTYGSLTIHRIDASASDRTAQLRGVSWWVNRRMVGQPSWDVLEGEGVYLDGRTTEAKRHSFIIEANWLRDDVKADWTGFHANARTNDTKSTAHAFVGEQVNRLVADLRRERKRTVLAQNAHVLVVLTPSSVHSG